MSLLPGQILPQSTPIGRVLEDGRVQINHNWWLLFYNLCLQSLSTGLPADALQILESVDLDVIDADAVSLRSRLEALAALIPTEADPVPYSDVRNALILAQDALLPDPPPRA